MGGESDPAKDLVADQADVWFINGQPPHEIDRLIGEVQGRGRDGAVQRPLRFGLAAFVIARETDEEAEAALAYHWELAGKDEPALAHIYAGADPKAVMFIIGTEMDYVDEKLQSGFVFRNPNEKGRCGCGESFHV